MGDEVAGEGGGVGVEGRGAQVGEEVGLGTGGKDDPAAHNGEIGDEPGETGALGVVGTHGLRLGDSAVGIISVPVSVWCALERQSQALTSPAARSPRPRPRGSRDMTRDQDQEVLSASIDRVICSGLSSPTCTSRTTPSPSMKKCEGTPMTPYAAEISWF